MANNLGSLVVSLGLNAAEFTAGLSKSEYQARQFARTLDSAVASGVVKAEIAIRALGAAARATFDVFQSLTTGAGQFQDLAEETGAAAVDLASLAVSAAAAGVTMESVGAAANKLTKSLVGVDDESKAAGAALKALNLNIDDFKKLDPVAQYEAVGRALAGYADGAQKTAVAQALFGKSGAEQLKVFKALEEAGGRQTILTQRQIELADAYGDQQAKTTAELKLYAQAAASEAIPAIADLTRVAAELAREFIGIDATTGQLAANNGAKQFAESAADALAFAADQADLFTRLFQIAGKTVAGYAAIVTAFSRGGLAEARAAGKAAEEDIQRVFERLTVADRLAKQREASALRSLGQDPRELARRGRPVGVDARPRLNFEGAIKPDKDKKTKDKISEADRLTESLQKQLQGINELTVAERVLQDIRSGSLGKVGIVQQEVLLGIAQEIDATKEAIRVAQERSDARKKDYEAANEAARENEKAERDRLRALTDGTATEVFKKQQADIEFLRQAFYDGKIAVEQYGEAVNVVMGNTAKETEKAKSAAEELGMTFASAFEDAIVEGENFSEVLKSLDKDLTRILIRKLVTEPGANAITSAINAGTSGGGWEGIAAAFMQGWGGGKAIGGPTMPNTLYRVGERRPEVFNDGSNQYLLTGSRRGYVDPNPRMGGRSVSVTNNFTVNGPIDRRTQNQLAAQAARSVAGANARLN